MTISKEYKRPFKVRAVSQFSFYTSHTDKVATAMMILFFLYEHGLTG